MTEDDIDSENPRPKGHYPRFADNGWQYVPDDLAQTISLGPAGDGEPGQDWVLSYTPDKRDEEDRVVDQILGAFSVVIEPDAGRPPGLVAVLELDYESGNDRPRPIIPDPDPSVGGDWGCEFAIILPWDIVHSMS